MNDGFEYEGIWDARSEIALNILGFLIGLYYAAIIKTRCPPALRGVGSTSRRPRLSPAERDDGGQAPKTSFLVKILTKHPPFHSTQFIHKLKSLLPVLI